MELDCFGFIPKQYELEPPSLSTYLAVQKVDSHKN